jgi:hypothetical protein
MDMYSFSMLLILKMCKFIQKLQVLMGANTAVTLTDGNIPSYSTITGGIIDSRDIKQTKTNSVAL